MPKYIDFMGEVVEFPDSMSDADITKVLDAEYAKKKKVEPTPKESPEGATGQGTGQAPDQSLYERIRGSIAGPKVKAFAGQKGPGIPTKEEAIQQLKKEGQFATTAGEVALGVATGGASLATRLTTGAAVAGVSETLRSKLEGQEDKDTAIDAGVAAGTSLVVDSILETLPAVPKQIMKFGLSQKGKMLVENLPVKKMAEALAASKESIGDVAESLSSTVNQIRKKAGLVFEEGVTNVPKGYRPQFEIPLVEGQAADDLAKSIIKNRKTSMPGMSGKDTVRFIRDVTEGKVKMTAEQLSEMGKMLNEAITNENNRTAKSLLIRTRENMMRQSGALKEVKQTFREEVKDTTLISKHLKRITDKESGEILEPEKLVKKLKDAWASTGKEKQRLVQDIRALDKKLGTNLEDQIVGTLLKEEMEKAAAKNLDMRQLLAGLSAVGVSTLGFSSLGLPTLGAASAIGAGTGFAARSKTGKQLSMQTTKLPQALGRTFQRSLVSGTGQGINEVRK